MIDNSVDAFSATLAYAVTGETRPYDKNAATYGAIRPTNNYGAVEVSVRYDHARNDGHGGYYDGASETGVVLASALRRLPLRPPPPRIRVPPSLPT